MTTKKCSNCIKIYDVSFFSKDKHRLDGLYVYCKVCVKEFSRQRYLNNKDKMIAAGKKWKTENREYYLNQQREYSKQYIKTFSHKFREYKNGALDRDLCFELTEEQFKSFWQLPCSYCGDSIETIGLDRKNNLIGYTIDNVKTCCTTCNIAKRAMTEREYINHCIKVAELNKNN